MRFDLTFGGPRSARRRDDDAPRRLLLLGDFGGDAQAAEPIAHRQIARIDIDTVDEMIARRVPSISLAPDLGGERLEFRRFDDFHPDTLLGRVPAFARLLDLRTRLQSPGTFASAVAELGAEAPVSTTPDPRPGEPAGETGASTLERLLGHKPDARSVVSPTPAADSVDSLIRRAVAPYVVAAQDPQVPQLVSAVDAALGDTMRAVLHAAAFQQVEATWRGLHWLVSSLELGDDLELHVLHLTRDELSAGVGPGSAVYRRLVHDEAGTAGGLQWAALIGHYRFEATAVDVSVLESLGELARALDAPFVAECGASLLGSAGLPEQPDPRGWMPLESAFEERWRALRGSPAAARLGLALPRFLLRLPYGRRSDPIERFGFEELPATPDHECFLWGNAALACALVIARVLQGDDGADPGQLAGLPAYVTGDGDESHVQPCAELWLNERALGAILDRGIMPLVSVKDTDVVRLVRLQSIADPPTALI
jgi:type VI secretion system ImpC/EvpB family protein/type VI secretion system ImpB/VipA family protein